MNNVEPTILGHKLIIDYKAETVSPNSNVIEIAMKRVGSNILPTELKDVVANAELKSTDPVNLPENLSERLNDVAMDALPESVNNATKSSLFYSMSDYVMSKFRSSPDVKSSADKEKSIEKKLEDRIANDVEDSEELEVLYDEEGYIINNPIDEKSNLNQLDVKFDIDEKIIEDEYENLSNDEALSESEEQQVVALDADNKEIKETKEEKKLRKSKEAAVTKIMLGASGIGGVVASTGIGGVAVETVGGIYLYSQTAQNTYVVSSKLLQYFVANGAGTAASTVANVSIFGVSAVTLGNVVAIGSTVYLGAKIGQWGYNKIFTEKEEEKINITTKTIATSVAGKVFGT